MKQQHRSRILILWLKIFLGFSLFTRLLLFSQCFPNVEAGMIQVLKIFAVGTLYDLAFFSYALPPIIIWLVLLPSRIWNHRIHQWLLRLMTLGLISFCLFNIVAEYLFWDEFQSRFNFIAVDYLVYTGEVIDNIIQSYPIFSIIGWIVLLTGIFYFILNDKMNFNDFGSGSSHRFRTCSPLLLLPVVFYLVLGQDFRKISDNAYQVQLCSNGPYQFVAAFRNNEMDFKTFYPSLDEEKTARLARELIRHKFGHFTSQRSEDLMQVVDFPQKETKLNVVLIMVESLSGHFMKAFGNTEDLTPNLDSLSSQSMFFTQCYATGTRTTRGLEAVTLSIPPTPGRSIVKRIGRESGMISLGSVFNTHGYQSRFIYGGRGFFDNMNAFFGGNGYEIVDQNSTPSEEMGFQNAWGMADEYLFAQALKKADSDFSQSRPFFYHIMTTSNHRPYTYPSNRIDIPSGTGRNGAVKYTDWAIGDFLKKAKAKPWFDNTLFVIIADHQASSAGKVSLPLMRYHIPLILYSPKHVQPTRIDKVCSQIDLPTTILSMLNLDYTATFYGHDVLDEKFSERALIGTYQALGLYKTPDLRLMRPVKMLELHQNAGTSNPRVSHATQLSSDYEELIAYYQSAATTYKGGFNKVDRLKGLK